MLEISLQRVAEHPETLRPHADTVDWIISPRSPQPTTSLITNRGEFRNWQTATSPIKLLFVSSLPLLPRLATGQDPTGSERSDATRWNASDARRTSSDRRRTETEGRFWESTVRVVFVTSWLCCIKPNLFESFPITWLGRWVVWQR